MLPVTTAAAHHYGVSVTAIGWLANVFPLLYVVLAVPAGLALDRWPRPALAVGALLTALGGVVRLGGDGFGWALAGQLMVAVAQPLVLNAITGVVGVLPARSRPTGIAVGSAGLFLGMVLALGAGAVVGGDHLVALATGQAVLGVLVTVAFVKLAMITIVFCTPDTTAAAVDCVVALCIVWVAACVCTLAESAESWIDPSPPATPLTLNGAPVRRPSGGAPSKCSVACRCDCASSRWYSTREV